MWQLLAGGLGALAVVGATYYVGDRNGYARRDLVAAKADLAQSVADRAREQRAAAVALQQEHDLANQLAGVRSYTNTIRERVPVYVPAAADARCRVPVGFVELHNQAAAGQDGSADPTAFADKTVDAGLALSAVAGTVASNYGTCHEWRTVAAGWQAWWTTTCKALGQDCSAPPATVPN